MGRYNEGQILVERGTGIRYKIVPPGCQTEWVRVKRCTAAATAHFPVSQWRQIKDFYAMASSASDWNATLPAKNDELLRAADDLGIDAKPDWNQDALELAAAHNKTVNFEYWKPNGDVSYREVEVEKLFTTSKGNKAILGTDLGDDSPKCFLLDRIEGDVLFGTES